MCSETPLAKAPDVSVRKNFVCCSLTHYFPTIFGHMHGGAMFLSPLIITQVVAILGSGQGASSCYLPGTGHSRTTGRLFTETCSCLDTFQ